MSDTPAVEPTQEQEVAINAFFDLLHPDLVDSIAWNLDEDGDVSLIDERSGRTIILLDDGIAIVFNRDEEEDDAIVLHDFVHWDNPVEIAERAAAVLGLRMRPDLDDYLEKITGEEAEA